MSFDAWAHVGEVIIGVILIPLSRKLVAVLIALNESAVLLSQSLEMHTASFEAHVKDDRERFHAADAKMQAIDTRVNAVDGNVREIMGWLQLDRRNGAERRLSPGGSG